MNERAYAGFQSQLESYLEGLLEGFVAYDSSWVMTYMNDAAERLLGRRREQVLGLTWHEAFPHAVGNAVDVMYQRVMRERRAERMEHDYSTPYGKWLEINAAPVEGGGVAVYFRDITDRKRAEEALRLSEQRLRESEATLRAFYESSPVCMGVVELVDGNSEVLHVFDNAATCRFFGVPAGGTEGKRARRELGADPRVIGRWIEAYRAAEASGAPSRFEHDYQTPDGVRWLAATVAAIGRGPSGQMRFCYTAEDVTEARKAHEELRESEQRLRLALEAGRMGTWEWHVPTGRVRWSPDLEAMHGYEPGGFPGTVEAYAAEVHPDDREYVQKVIAATFAGEEHLIEYRIVRRDGGVRWVEGRGKLFRDAQGNPLRLVGVCTDVTARKDAEARLREADRRKDEFLATLSHELRNPLAPVANAVQIMKVRAPADPQLAWAREVIERQLRQMSRLLDDLLDLGRITSGKIELRKARVPLARILESAIETSRPLIDAGRHELELSLPGEPLLLDADALRLGQVFANLLNNAAKYTPDRGRIRVQARRDGESVAVSVSDNGMGLEPHMLREAFEMFVQGTPARERGAGGLGIGLSLAKALVEQHGGSIEAKSDGPGRGAEFRVRLPAAAG